MMTHLSDLEVKVMGHRWVTDVVAKHKSGELRCPATALIHSGNAIIFDSKYDIQFASWCFISK